MALKAHSLTTVAAMWLADIGADPATGKSGITPKTQKTYAGHLARFELRLDGARFAEVTPDHVRQFIDVGEDGRSRSDRSRAALLGIIYGLYAWASDPDVPVEVGHNPAARLRADQRSRRRAPRDVRPGRWLTQHWADTLIDTTYGEGTDPLDVRDAVLLTLYLCTGMRCVELLSVRWAQVDFAGGGHGMLRSVRRKGGKVTDIPLNPMAAELLAEWRASFVAAVGSDIGGLGIIPQCHANPDQRRARAAGGEYLPSGGAVTSTTIVVWRRSINTASTVRRIVADRAAAAGLTAGLAPHDLRRSYAGLLEENGATLREISAALAHEHISTTERYLAKRAKLPEAAAGLSFGSRAKKGRLRHLASA
jgi:integrase